MEEQSQQSTMHSITIPKYSPPAEYELTRMPPPTITSPKDVLIRVAAASINPIDVKKASGVSKPVLKDAFPYKIGYDCAGTVAETGSDVTRFKKGDEIYVRLPECHRGAWAEFVKTTEEFVALKPATMSMAHAASIPLAGMTALQALRKYPGDLQGKTVFVPAGLSGTGLFACQLAKNVFKAGKVITTVSTEKVPKVPELLGEGVVDEIIDYKTTDPKTHIPPKSIDFLFDTTGDALNYLPHMTPQTGTIITIAILTSGDVLANSSLMRLTPDGSQKAPMPFAVRCGLNVLDRIRVLRAARWKVKYESIFLEPNGDDLETLRGWIQEGKVRTVVGTTVSLKNLDGVRDACQVVYAGKGGIGKAVILVE